jgi:L-amino acid N-acyltransferase YncA
MNMQIKLRKAVETDWPAILEAANAAVLWAPRDNQEWLSNRMRFDQTGYVRRHYVATDAATGKVIGYGAVEAGQESDRYRIFLVMSPDLLTEGMGDLMYDQLMADLVTLHASVVWTHGYARDLTMLGFLSQHGFSEIRRFPLPGSETDVVLMERHIQ